jgi:DNA-binding Lrp family transcriptional regulator
MRTIRLRQNRCRFYFLGPAANGNARSFVEKLARLKGVKEVHLTEGRYGFVVKAVEIGHDHNQFENYVRTRVKTRVEVAMSHYSYRKGE